MASESSLIIYGSEGFLHLACCRATCEGHLERGLSISRNGLLGFVCRFPISARGNRQSFEPTEFEAVSKGKHRLWKCKRADAGGSRFRKLSRRKKGDRVLD